MTKRQNEKTNNTTTTDNFYTVKNQEIRQQMSMLILNKPEVEFSIYDIEKYILDSDKFVVNSVLKLYSLFLIRRDQIKSGMFTQGRLFELELIKDPNKIIKVPEDFDLDPKLRVIARNIIIKNKVYIQDIKKARVLLLKYTNFITTIANGDLSFIC